MTHIFNNFLNYISRHGDFAARKFNGPIILVKFSSINFNPTGNNSGIPSFTLLFRGCGPNISNPPTFTHHLREKIPGEAQVVTYPEQEGTYPSNQLITYLGLRKDRAIISNSEGDWKVKVRSFFFFQMFQFFYNFTKCCG